MLIDIDGGSDPVYISRLRKILDTIHLFSLPSSLHRMKLNEADPIKAEYNRKAQGK